MRLAEAGGAVDVDGGREVRPFEDEDRRVFRVDLALREQDRVRAGADGRARRRGPSLRSPSPERVPDVRFDELRETVVADGVEVKVRPKSTRFAVRSLEVAPERGVPGRELRGDGVPQGHLPQPVERRERGAARERGQRLRDVGRDQRRRPRLAVASRRVAERVADAQRRSRRGLEERVRLAT